VYKVAEENTPETIKQTLEFARIDSFKPEQISKIEVWGSSFSDPGEDYCLYILFGLDGQELGRKRIPGY